MVLILLAGLLGSQNKQMTEFNYFIANSHISVASLVGISLVFGALLSSLFWMSYSMHLKLQLRKNSMKLVKSLNEDN